jgi:hypothetical protein
LQKSEKPVAATAQVPLVHWAVGAHVGADGLQAPPTGVSGWQVFFEESQWKPSTHDVRL